MPTYGDKFTPILLAIKCNYYEIFLYLAFELKCNIEAVDLKRNTALHLAVEAENVEIIRKLVHLDSDSGTMRSQKNINNQTPVDLGGAKYNDILVTIWDRVKQGHLTKVRELV
jgi:ankyrin repeat protein